MTRGFRLPDRTYLPAVFERLAISHEDQQEILAAWPSPDADPETWDALERAHATLVKDLGGFAPIDLPGPAVETTPLGRYFFVYVYLAALADVRRFHAQRRIPDDISWATLSDLGRNVTRRANPSASQAGPPAPVSDGGEFVACRLRALVAIDPEGRVPWRFIDGPDRCRAARRDRRTGGFRRRPPAPGARRADHSCRQPLDPGLPLDPLACDASFRRAREVYPNHHTAQCTSWLLDPQLAEYLEPDSNIVGFQRRFTLVGEGYEGDADVLRFVFHRIAPNIDDLRQRTTLERAIVAHLKAGKHWRSRTGWLTL